MSFSRAKRFNYKSPDTYCSPADYLLNLGFEKGCSIPKCPRFRYYRNDDDNSITCSRLSHGHCTQNNPNPKCCAKRDEKSLNGNFSGFDRNDTKRKSFKASKKQHQPRNAAFNTSKRLENPLMDTSDQSEEFIDDDFGYLTCSEDLDHLKDIEEYEFNEVYKALKGIKGKRSTVASKQNNAPNFQDYVIKKLESIDRNVKIIKEDMDCSPRNRFVEQLHYHYKSVHPPNRNQQDVLRNIIIKTIQKLKKNFDKKRKSMLRDNQERILDILDEMYTTSDKSSAQIKEMCNESAEELITNLSKVLQTSMCNFTSENDIEDLVEECISQYYDDSMLNKCNSEPLQNLISDYLTQTQEVGQDLEEDLSDITLRCEDTQQMLHVQGLLLDEMKNEIQNLKCSMTEE